MKMPAKLSVVTVLVASLACASRADAADPPNVNQDLAAVIALHGQPCGQVVSVERRGDNDYVATCSNGNRYHVFVRDGRVVVEKQ